MFLSSILLGSIFFGVINFLASRISLSFLKIIIPMGDLVSVAAVVLWVPSNRKNSDLRCDLLKS